MSRGLLFNKAYKVWLQELKDRIRLVQIKATVSINTELLNLYWNIGAEIVIKQKKAKWGDGLIEHLSKDLAREFPNMKGFSRSNLMYIKQWYLFYSRKTKKVQQPVGQMFPHSKAFVQQVSALITKIPWSHNIVIITKCKKIEEALYYVQKTIEHNWSRNILTMQIESQLYKRAGHAINNFAAVLPLPQSDLAKQTLKDPYVFDFLSMTDHFQERELETGLIEHLTSFLLELGAGFSFVGKQYRVLVGDREFFIDLLLYHTRLHCYIIVELKSSDFEPEYVGQLNFYIKTIDVQLRQKNDQPTLGLLLCKSKDKLVAEYALSDINKPIGISEYRVGHKLPKNLEDKLPSLEQIKRGVIERMRMS